MTILLEDTFTAANGTLLGGHSGETSAVWASNAYFGSGNGTADEFVISAGRLRRPSFGDPIGYVGGVAVAYSATSPDLDALQHVDVTFDVVFDATVTNSYVALHYNAQDTVGAPILLFELSHNGTTGALFIPGYGSTSVALSLDTPHAVSAKIRGANLVYSINGVVVRVIPDVSPVGKLGFTIFDFNGESRASIDNLVASTVEAVSYYDDFPGSGTLDAYTSNTGAGYLAGSPLVSLVREGGGYLTTLTSTETRHAIADAPVGVGQTKIEFIGERVTSAGTGVWLVGVRLISPGGLAPTTDPTFGVNVRYLGGTTELFVYDGDGGVTTGVNSIAGTPSPLTDLPFYVVVDLDADTQEIAVQFNGVEVYRSAVTVAALTDWRPVLTIRSSAARDTRIHYAGVMVSAPVEPVGFWTQRVRAIETV